MANSMKAIFEEGQDMVRTGRAQNARQCPYHHREQIECWRAGFRIAMEELKAIVKADKKAEAEAPPQVKHVGSTSEDLKFVEKREVTEKERTAALGKTPVRKLPVNVDYNNKKKPKKTGKKRSSTKS